MFPIASVNTRDFVCFNNYYQLSIENIKSACEEFYHSPSGFCDLLGSDSEPFWIHKEQVNVYLVRSVEVKESLISDRPTSSGRERL